VTDSLLRAATARSAGHLETLDVTGCARVTHAALLAVVTANSASLRELHVRGAMPSVSYDSLLAVAEVEALLRAAPGLRACHAEAMISEVPVARALLRAEPPFAALRLELLSLGDYEAEGTFLDMHAVLQLVPDLSACTFLRELELTSVRIGTPAAPDLLVDAALACRLRNLRLIDCDLPAAWAPALARLVRGGALAQLVIDGGEDADLDAPAVMVLANALRACSTLTSLTLRGVGLWRDVGAATALVGALTGHASLQTLGLSQDDLSAADWAVAGAAFGALVAANAPALQELCLPCCNVGNAGLRPLFDALPRNTHLRMLYCWLNDVTNAFARDALLPAVRANGSLRQLFCKPQRAGAADHALAEAEALVARRAAGR
jgi:hypothetical protein